MSNVAIDALLKRRQEFIDQKTKFNESIDNAISDIDKSIALLEGGARPVQGDTVVYDDETNDYIKGTEDGI